MPKVPKPPIELIDQAISGVAKIVGKVIKTKGPTKAAQRAVSKKLAESETAQLNRAARIAQDKKIIDSSNRGLSKIEVNEANSRSAQYRSMREVGLTKRPPSSARKSESVANRDMGGLKKRYATQSAKLEQLKAEARALPIGPAKRKAEQKMRDYRNKTGFR